MAEVDTSIYKQPQTNPLDNLTKIMGVVGQANQNKLFQQTYQAREGVAKAYRDNVGPDGKIDQGGLLRDLAQSGFGAGEATGQGISNATADFGLAKARTDYVANTLGTAINSPNLTPQSVTGTLLTLGKAANIPPEMIHHFISTLPNNPKALRNHLTNIQNTLLGMQGAARTETIGPEGERSSVPLAAVTGAKTPTGLSPAAGAAAQITGGGSGTLLANARENSVSFPRQVFPLEQAISSLERLGPQGTGPGSDTINHIKSFALTMGMPSVDAKKIVDFDTAKKYLTDFVNQTGNSGTNEKLQAAFAGNPSVHIANESAVKVAKAALALRRADEARMKAFEDAGLPESDFAKFAGKWNREHDVRVYGMDLMTAEQRKNVLKDLPQSKRDLFMFDAHQAEQLGILRPPRLLPPPDKKK